MKTETCCQVICFDGRTFTGLDMRHATSLYLCYQARRGDEGAAELLNAYRVRIDDDEGQTYWPIA